MAILSELEKDIRVRELKSSSIKLKELSQRAKVFWSIRDHEDLKKIIQLLVKVSEL